MCIHIRIYICAHLVFDSVYVTNDVMYISLILYKCMSVCIALIECKCMCMLTTGDVNARMPREEKLSRKFLFSIESTLEIYLKISEAPVTIFQP